MSNHKIIFYGDDASEEHKLECFKNDNNSIFISIDMHFNQVPDWITLDKATAIKLSRVLKSEISKIES
jgi:hypothetical protein